MCVYQSLFSTGGKPKQEPENQAAARFLMLIIADWQYLCASQGDFFTTVNRAQRWFGFSGRK